MPTTRTVQQLSLTGVAPTSFTPDATGDKFAMPSSGEVNIRVTTTSTAATMTITDPNSVSPEGAQSFTPNVQLVMSTAQTRVLKISDARRFTNATDGLVSLGWSAVTGVSVELTA